MLQVSSWWALGVAKNRQNMRLGVALWAASVALIGVVLWVASLVPVPTGWTYSDVEYHLAPLIIGVVPAAIWAYRKPLRQYRDYDDVDPHRSSLVSVVATLFGIWALKGTGELFLITAHVLDSGVAGMGASGIWVAAMAYIMIGIWEVTLAPSTRHGPVEAVRAGI